MWRTLSAMARPQQAVHCRVVDELLFSFLAVNLHCLIPYAVWPFSYLVPEGQRAFCEAQGVL